MHFTRWFYAAPLRLRSLFRRPQVERELDEEIGYHIERQIQENTAKGLTPDEARYAALRTFSGVDQSKEACRDTLRVNVIGDLFQDLRYVLRTLRHSPGFTTVAVLSLALGIGANTAVFSAIDPLFLRRVAVQNAGELISFRAVRPDLRLLVPSMSAANLSFYTRPGLSYREFQRLRDGNQSFSGVFTFTAANNARILAGAGDSVGQVEEVRAQQASGGFFSTLEVAPALGRLFDETDERIESQPVVVISHSFWQRRFGLAPDIVGKPISFVSSSDPRSIGGRLAATIIGVAPAGFSGPEVGACCDVWVPLVDKPIGRSPLDPTWWSITRPMMGRLQPGFDPEAGAN